MRSALALTVMVLLVAGCATTDTATTSTSADSTPPPALQEITIDYPDGWTVRPFTTVHGATHPWILAVFTTAVETYIGITSPERGEGGWTLGKLAVGPTQASDLYAVEKDGKVHAFLTVQQSPNGLAYAEWATFDGDGWSFRGPLQWPNKSAGGVAVAANRLYALASAGTSDLWSSPDGVTWTLEAPVPEMQFSAGLAGNATHLMVCGLATNGDRVVKERALPGVTYETKVLRAGSGGKVGIDSILCDGAADEHGAPFFGFAAQGTFLDAAHDGDGYGAVRGPEGWQSTVLTPDRPFPLAVHAHNGTFYEFGREGVGDVETLLFRYTAATGWQACRDVPARNVSDSPGFLEWQGRTWMAHLTWESKLPMVLTPLPDACEPL